MNNDNDLPGSAGNGVKPFTKEQLEGLTATGRTPSEPELQELPTKPSPDAATFTLQEQGVQQFCYSLVLAEVIYSTDKGIASHRCQLFSKADVLNFPAARLGQLQNSAAHQVQAQVNEKSFQAIEVIIHNILNLGWMTDVQFWGSQANIPVQEKDADPKPPVISNNSDNVVPITRP